MSNYSHGARVDAQSLHLRRWLEDIPNLDAVGVLNYLAIATRPDLSYTVGTLQLQSCVLSVRESLRDQDKRLLNCSLLHLTAREVVERYLQEDLGILTYACSGYCKPNPTR